MAFVKGQSGNPSGRPRGAAGLARLVMEQTRDGAELVETLLHIMRMPGARPRDRLTACELLLDRAVGKPLATTELRATVAPALPELPAGWDDMPPDARERWLDGVMPLMLAAPATEG